jgi:hypothetical protein
LVKIGIPYDVIMGLSSTDLNIVIGLEEAVRQREQEAHEQEQRKSNNRKNMSFG